MKTLLLTIAILTLTITTNASNFKTILSASDVIYSTQTILNDSLNNTNQLSFTMVEVKNILGTEKFKSFVSALNVFSQNGLIFVNLEGQNEININNILKLKYGVKFSELPTYNEPTTKTETIKGKTINTTIWTLTSYSNK